MGAIFLAMNFALVSVSHLPACMVATELAI